MMLIRSVPNHFTLTYLTQLTSIHVYSSTYNTSNDNGVVILTMDVYATQMRHSLVCLLRANDVWFCL